VTEYSSQIEGTLRNYNWPVRFDHTDGFVGVDQYDEEGHVKSRVLLSPVQVEELIVFVKRYAR